MSEKNRINSMVRRKLRQLRVNRKMKLRQIATQAGIPLSSYACMESGHYNISLDHLFRILGALDADIGDVWPVETVGVGGVADRLYLQRIQNFRLSEIIALSGAEGGALFAVRKGHCEVVLHQSLSDFLLDRLILYLEDGRNYSEGIWLERSYGDTTLHFFLKSGNCPDFVKAMVRRYLVIWSHLF
jgi:transcriptional regulator with XRE-family HTH domain